MSKKIFLNEPATKVPNCNQTCHNFKVIKKPKRNRSGLREEKCMNCGIIIAYDTSD
jgi:hypothetical protein